MCLYRCKCGVRRALPRPHTSYVRPPKCKACGSLLTYRDKYQEKRNQENKCTFNGAAFPHQAGSVLFCEQSTKEPTHEDYADYYGVRP